MKAKINKDRPKISSEEIAKGRDFNSVLEQFNTSTPGGASNSGSSGINPQNVVKPFFKNIWFISGVSLTALAIITTLIITNLTPSDTPSDQTEVNDASQSALADLDAAMGINSGIYSPYVRPPVHNLEPEFSKYKVPAGKSSKIDYESGTTLTIPGNAFVDLDGNIVDGDIEIHYREMMDPIDFIMSGIPMNYDSAGTEYVFESAGMIEIYGYKDGEEVKINPEKKIHVEMASEYDGTHYNMYSLDTVKRNWQYIGKDEIIRSESDMDFVVDDSFPDSVKQDIARIEQEMKMEVDKLKKEPEMVECRKRINTIKVEIDKIKKEKPFEPKKANKSAYSFDLNIDLDDFPEFATYSDMFFEVKKGEDFSQADYTIEWEDISIKEIGSKNDNKLRLEMILTKGKTIKRFEVIPVFSDNDFEAAMVTYNKKFEEYQEKLTERIEKEKQENEQYLANIKELERKWKEEAAARRAEYLQQQEKMYAQVNIQSKVTRAFEISGFGVINCDSPSRYPSGRTISAYFADKNGDPMNINTIFLVQEGRNAIFTYHKGNFNRFKFNPKARNLIYGINDDFKICFFTSDDFKRIPDGEMNYKFEMNIVEKELKTLNEIKEYFGV